MNIHRQNYQDTFVELISGLLEQLLWSFKASKTDRKRLYDEEFDRPENSFSAFSEILIYSESIEGYADSIAKHGKCREPNEALKNLIESDIFRNREFRNWFLENHANYSKLTSYLLMVDYLRYRIIEYLTNQQQA